MTILDRLNQYYKIYQYLRQIKHNTITADIINLLWDGRCLLKQPFKNLPKGNSLKKHMKKKMSNRRQDHPTRSQSIRDTMCCLVPSWNERHRKCDPATLENREAIAIARI